MCNWINIKWNECGLVIVIVMNDLEITSISMVAQWSVQLSWEAVAVVGGVSGSGWSPVARVVVLSFFCFFCLAIYSSFFFFLSELAIDSNFLF